MTDTTLPRPASYRILVVDDNDAIHADFRKILAPTPAAPASRLASAKALLFGGAAPTDTTASAPVAPTTFTLDSALQGQEGLSKLQAALKDNEPYAVAFVDMRMPPGWDGLQTIQRLWDVDPDLQVVICSAYSDFSWEEISSSLGLTDRLLILKKPFDPMEVTQIATALTEKWFLRRAAKLKTDELERMVASRTRELSHLALHDKLTGLPNRTMFLERLDAAINRPAGAAQPTPYALLFLDFDRFKIVNDSLGHDAGDQLLKDIAVRISAALNLAAPSLGAALAARVGGDEFVVLLDGLPRTADAATFADSLLRLLATPYSLAGRDVHCSASIGITTSDLAYTCAADALRDADTAMYHAKAAGKGRYVHFDRAMHQRVLARLELEHDLRAAVDRDEFVVHYQPIVSLVTGRVHGFEALVRWAHPRRGLLSPAEFIPLCEETGLVVQLGSRVLETACAQLAQWTRKFPALAHLSVSVNVAPRQLLWPDIVDHVRQVLATTGIRPAALSLEVTESGVITNPDEAAAVLNQIRALGVRVVMDDFGTGYSALSTLHQLPLDGLKIDRAFMRNVSEHREYAAVVHAIVTLARNLGMTLTAEGIESAEQIALLQAMDCDLAQGYHFARPGNANDAEAYLLSQLALPAAA